jgi:hypothetical protein
VPAGIMARQSGTLVFTHDHLPPATEAEVKLVPQSGHSSRPNLWALAALDVHCSKKTTFIYLFFKSKFLPIIFLLIKFTLN